MGQLGTPTLESVRRWETISAQRTLLDSLTLLVNVMIYHCLSLYVFVYVGVCVLCVCVCLCTKSRLLLFIVAMFYKVTSNTELANTEALLLEQI